MTPIPLLEKIKEVLIQPFIYLLFAVALAYFFWGVAEYIQGASAPDKRKTGSAHIIYGLIGLVIMFSVMALLNIICNTVGCAG